MIRPLGDRVLIKPEANPNTTESGLVLVEQKQPEQIGTVVSVGLCSHPLKAEAEALAEKLDAVDLWAAGETVGSDAAHMLRDLVRRTPDVKVGDFVLFSWASGQELQIDDERYLLMRESDILAVYEGEPA